MPKVDILGVKVNAVARKQVQERIGEILRTGQKRNYFTTTYSEFIVAAQHDGNFKKILNDADLNLPDGIGVLWAATYLNSNFKTQNSKQGLSWSLIWFLQTAWWTAFDHAKIQKIIPERISGADIVYDIARIAEETGSSVFLLGGYGDIAGALRGQFPKLVIAGRHEGNPEESELAEMVNQSNADILMVAFGPVKQEYWIKNNLPKLDVKIAIGLGGTFDYVLGRRKRAGEFWTSHGLEWLHRLLTQPWRWKRMWKAIIVFSWMVVKERHRHRKRSAG